MRRRGTPTRRTRWHRSLGTTPATRLDPTTRPSPALLPHRPSLPLLAWQGSLSRLGTQAQHWLLLLLLLLLPRLLPPARDGGSGLCCAPGREGRNRFGCSAPRSSVQPRRLASVPVSREAGILCISETALGPSNLTVLSPIRGAARSTPTGGEQAGNLGKPPLKMATEMKHKRRALKSRKCANTTNKTKQNQANLSNGYERHTEVIGFVGTIIWYLIIIKYARRLVH